MAGFDTASYVYDVRVAAVNAFGTPNFWLRYFSPCQTTAFNANWTNATSESRAIWDSGGPKLGAITVPTQSRLSGTTAMGQADAQTLGNSLHNTWLNIGPLQLPTNGQLWGWLRPAAALSVHVHGPVQRAAELLHRRPLRRELVLLDLVVPSIEVQLQQPEPAAVGGKHVQRLRAELSAHADEPLAVRLSELRLLPQRRPGPRRRHHLRELLLLPILAAVGRS